MRDAGAPGLGEPHGPRAALDERHARLALERGDLLRDRGGGESERLRRGGDGAVFRDGAQHPHAPNVEHKRILLNRKKIQW